MPTPRKLTPTQAAAALPLLPRWALINDDDDDDDHDEPGSEGGAVLVFDGDLSLPSLDLDVDSPDTQGARQIVVTGNLEVSGNIVNSNTDGAVGLTVLGDLRAHNVAVGGQIVHVAGSVHVAQLCCGSYNHGDMTIAGDLHAHCVLIDDYTLAVAGSVRAAVVSTLDLADDGSDWSIRRYDAACDFGIAQEPHPQKVRGIHPMQGLLPCAFGWEGLSFDAVVTALARGWAVIDEAGLAQAAAPPVSRVVDTSSVRLDAPSVLALQASALVGSDDKDLELHGEPFVRITKAHVDDDGDPDSGSVFVQHGVRKALFWVDDDGGVDTGIADVARDLKAARQRDAPELARLFRLAWQVIRSVEAMQAHTPAQTLRTLAASLTSDDEPECNEGWCTLARADGDGTGERLTVRGPRCGVDFMFEVEGDACLRYLDDDDSDDYDPITFDDDATHAQAAAHFRKAVMHFESLIVERNAEHAQAQAQAHGASDARTPSQPSAPALDAAVAAPPPAPFPPLPRAIAYEIDLQPLPVDRKSSDNHGWRFGLPPGIEPLQWPLDPRTGHPMRHAFTLLLPEAYRCRGADLVAISVFDGDWQGNPVKQNRRVAEVWNAQAPPEILDLMPVWNHRRHARHPHEHRMTDELAEPYAVIWLTRAEFDGKLCEPILPTWSKLMRADLLPQWTRIGAAAAYLNASGFDAEAADEDSATVRELGGVPPQELGYALALRWRERQGDPNAGIVPPAGWLDEAITPEGYHRPNRADPCPDGATHEQIQAAYAQHEWARAFTWHHIGGTMDPYQGYPSPAFSPYHVGFGEAMGGFNFGGGNAQLDLWQMRIDWACG